MDADIKREWVAALRSGEYKQGRGQLCIDDHYCCLGVLYDACIDGEWVRGPGGGWSIGPHGVQTANLPFPVCDAIGLRLGDQDRLIRMNDGGHKSFAQIADWIEANL